MSTALQPGTPLGDFEVLSLLGEGGMGVVYRARDTKLGRDVAIKMLLPEVAESPERLARLRQEAQVLASLNHPRIAQIYGLQETARGPCLVLELVEGPTLADRIAQGPLPLDEALPIADQIAEALEWAHDQRIIHRDLKPANIKLRADGSVKVLDFGLAKALTSESSQASLAVSASPTLASPARTQTGVILGTASYMSPEQAKARPADRRSDIWAFGCVLYEMLTGVRPFGGDDVSETVAAILRDEPDWSRLPPTLPPSIRTLLRRCLQKDVAKRLGHINAARLELSDPQAIQAPSHDVAVARTKRSTNRLERLAWATICVALLGAVAYLWRAWPAPAKAGTVARFRIDAPTGEMFPGAGGAPRFEISPDGSSIVFASMQPGKEEHFWLQRFDDGTTRLLTSTATVENNGDATQSPFWSPDGDAFGFFGEGKLKLVDIRRDTVRELGDFRGVNFGGSWSPAGVIIVGSGESGGIQQVPATGGSLQPVTHLDATRNEVAHLYPKFLPDGRHFLFAATKVESRGASTVFVGSLDSTDRIELTASDGGFTFVAPDRVLFLRGTTLLAQRIDLRAYHLVGEPSIVAPAVRRPSNGRLAASGAASGVIAFAEAGTTRDPLRAIWVDRAGRTVDSLPALTLAVPTVRISPDGRRIAFIRGLDLWVQDLERGTETQVTSADGQSFYPVWAPDGTSLGYVGVRGASQRIGIFRKRIDSPDPEELLPVNAMPNRAMALLDWTSVGNAMLVSDLVSLGPSTGIGNGRSLRMLSLPGPPEGKNYLDAPKGVGQARLSPDGRWVAFESNESALPQVILQSFPDPTLFRRQISTDRGTSPRWRGDGRELYYQDAKSRIVAVPLSFTPLPVIGSPSPLFEMRDTQLFSGFEVTADGKRFAFLRPTGGNRITVVVNWTSSLTR